MKAHSENALLLAQWLEKQPKVKQVCGAGVTPAAFTLARTQQSGFPAAIVSSFEVEGGQNGGLARD